MQYISLPTKSRQIMHLDMNSYFASVEQQANPLLRGKPIGVCAYVSPMGCIIASSIEAKKYGVKTGMRVRDGKKLCPQLILIENDPIKYRSTTEKIFSIFADYTDRIEPYSIDEAFLDMTGFRWTVKSLEKLGLEIKQRIKDEVGEWLKASVGISHTRWLAKFASDIVEKDGILTITEENLISILQKTKLTDAWGIAERMQFRLHMLGITTLVELKNTNPYTLMQSFGKPGYFLWCHVNGIEVIGVRTQEETKPKSVGHSYCLQKKSKDPGVIEPILMKLCEKTGRRLREKRLEAHVIYLGWDYVGYGGMYKSMKLPAPLFDTKSIFDACKRIMLQKPFEDTVRMLAVTVTSLKPLSRQSTLFDGIQKRNDIALAMDAINNRYGEYTLMHGNMFDTNQFAKDRIGFRKSVGVQYNEKNAINYR